MEKNAAESDDASIKPVSSLRAKFEGLKPAPHSRNGAPSPSRPPHALHMLEPETAAPTVRASFDLPRPSSPWAQHNASSPRTPAAERGRSTSPPKSSHKRPMSMVMQSSPQLTPAVNVESPRSPPRMQFSPGTPSSPTKTDTSPIGKVKDLVSHHSSRMTSPATTPLLPPQPDVNQATVPTASLSGTTRPHPPVNRAEKPKIPAKPIAVSQSVLPVPEGASLQPLPPRRPSSDARLSPFSTPPDSDESPGSPKSLPAAHEISESLKSLPQASPEPSASTPPKPIDPRAVGFSKMTTAPTRDPRTLGFANHEPRPPSRDTVSTSAPSRANTLSERPTSRDPRSLGFSGTPPFQRHVSEQIRSTPPPPQAAPPLHAVPPKAPTYRDPRSLGFGASVSKDSAVEEPGPGLPPRPAARAPPPRPSEESKNIPPKPPAPRGTPAIVPDRSTKPGAAPVPSRAPPLSTEIRFPPPPKRGTGDSDMAPPLPRRTATDTSGHDSDEVEEPVAAPNTLKNEYPDATQTNRRPPYFKTGLRDINVKGDSRSYDVCGRNLCTAGYTTRVFDMSTGEVVTSINHGETVKATAVAFKPAAEREGEGKTIWIGNNVGDLLEIDVLSHNVVAQSSAHNRREIVQILRHRKDLWTLDDDGKLFVWQADESGMPDLRYRHIAHKVQKGHSCSLVLGDKLWLATGKEVRVYRPGNEATFAALTKPLSQSGTGDITSATYTEDHGGKVYFGHTDGKVTIYSAKDYACLGIVKVSDYKINGLSIVGDNLWVAYKTGKIYVYNITKMPWKVQKDWRAHDGPVSGLVRDNSSIWTLQRLQIVSVGQDGHARLWDGMLEDDWIENAMKERDIQYCSFREVSAAVITWNAGAVSPYDLRTDFIADAIHAENPPDILVFGFQEVVDLEDRAVTAKSLFGFGKKKDPDTSEQHQSRVYREWRDYLSKVISRASVHYRYAEVHTSSLVGLFQCIFIRQEERANMRDVNAINVKCGMKGHYGNKGALVTRFTLDDSSLCFVNCHLAAGQTQTSHRNNDVATILESENLPPERDPDTRMSLFVGGGDGTQILDHEICILNGDLNYRIDAIPRDTVVKLIKTNDLGKLLERDQLLVSRRRVAGFRLNTFVELPITFAPTYKYDVGTDNYDSSDKKRAPAWCDRLLYRGPGRIKQVEYRRHEVKVSDHRPVSGMFKIRLKTIDAKKRAQVKETCLQEFEAIKKILAQKASQRYLVNELGLDEGEARGLLTGT